LAFHSGREGDHSPPTSAEVKEWVELYIHSPNMPLCVMLSEGGGTGITSLYIHECNFDLLFLYANTFHIFRRFISYQ
jgi:hypothetical protein